MSDWVADGNLSLVVGHPMSPSCGLIADDPRVCMNGPPPRGWRVVERFVALPTPRRAELLVPIGRRSGTAALRRFANGSGAGLRLAAAAAGVALTAGAAPLLPGRVSIAVDPSVAGDELAGLVLADRLRRQFGDERLALAVRLGARRPNGKPVAQAVLPSGAAVAFAKIGWNALTRPLVEHEGELLASMTGAAAPRTFAVPRVLWAGDWAGHRLLVTSPAGGRAAPAEPPIEQTAELAGRGGLERIALGGSNWWRALRERIRACEPPVGTSRLAQAAEQVARRHGERELAFGTAHGDWTPWNMAICDGRLHVWDWERAASGVPVGLDVAHHLLLVSLRQRRRPPRAALRETFRRAPRLIGEIGGDSTAGEAVVELELLEMAVRFAEGRAAGAPVTHDLFLDSLLARAG